MQTSGTSGKCNYTTEDQKQKARGFFGTPPVHIHRHVHPYGIGNCAEWSGRLASKDFNLLLLSGSVVECWERLKRERIGSFGAEKTEAAVPQGCLDHR